MAKLGEACYLVKEGEVAEGAVDVLALWVCDVLGYEGVVSEVIVYGEPEVLSAGEAADVVVWEDEDVLVDEEDVWAKVGDEAFEFLPEVVVVAFGVPGGIEGEIFVHVHIHVLGDLSEFLNGKDIP